MGTDNLGRDIAIRILHGAPVSLQVSVFSVLISLLIGVFLGEMAGLLGGVADSIIMRLMDVILAFPQLILAIAIVTMLGPGLQNALIAISIVSIPAYARVVRASVLSIKETDFVSASRALGASDAHILFFRVLPNAITPLIVQGTLGIASAILDAAALSFIGLGAQPPTPEWGSMLGAERNQVFTAPHLVFFPGIAIMLTVLGFNLLGDGLRDALDPRLAQTGIKVKV
jgi:ABC-type dipeptide/oligopeptide/nickel transport system permease subunit